jgi:hypothetical protein
MKKSFFLSLLIVLSVGTFSQWVVDYDPYLTTPYYINVVDTGTIWCLGYTSGWWDTVEVMTKTPEFGWQWGNGNDLPTGIQFLSIAGLNSTTAFVGDFYGRIYKTTNYGWNWSVIINAGSNYYVTDIKFSKVNKNVGYIFCCRNDNVAGIFKIYKTTDYGTTWQLFTPYFGNNVIGNKPQICVTDSNHAWIGLWCLSQNCPFVQIAYTTNGGADWLISNVDTGRRGILSVVFSFDNQYGIATTYKGITPHNLLISTNGGENWNLHDTLPSGLILSFITVPETSVWYVNGYTVFPNSTVKSYIYKSSNNGLNWLEMTSEDSTYDISDMDAVKLNGNIFAWAAYPGKVLKLVDTAIVIGINNNGSVIPDNFGLLQNHPNPFNPVTRIFYDIPKSSHVILTVYDVHGRELRKLVNEIKGTGRYSVEFVGTNLASGVYFYRLEAEKFSASKKMVLIK